MAGRGGPSGGARSRLGARAIYEDFRPISDWKSEKEGQEPHLLLIQLHGFSKEQIKVSTESKNTLRIRGERLIGGNKWSRFEEDFRIPIDCDIRGIQAKFESGTLTITMPKKVPLTTTTQVSPKKEGTQKRPLEAPLKGPDNEKGPAKIEQETKEKVSTKVMEKVKESKKDEYAKGDSVKKANEVDEGNGFSGKVGEKSKKVIEKYKKVKEGFNNGEETTSFKPRNYFEKIDKEKSWEVKDKEKEKFKEVKEGLKIGNATKEEGSGKGPFKHGNYIEKDEKKAKDGISSGGKDNEKENYKEKVKGITKGELEEERKLMVNIGVAVLVIVALGAYIYYGSYGKAKV